MPNQIVIEGCNGERGNFTLDKWPPLEDLQKFVGGKILELPINYTVGITPELPAQRSAIYVNEEGLLLKLPVNESPLAEDINKHLPYEPSLVGNIVLITGDPEFMSQKPGY